MSADADNKAAGNTDSPGVCEKWGERLGGILGAGVGAAYSFGPIAKIATALGATGIANAVTGTTGATIGTFFTAGAGAFAMPLLALGALGAAGYYVYKHGFAHPKTVASAVTGIGTIYNVIDQVTRNNAGWYEKTTDAINGKIVDSIGDVAEWAAPTTVKTYTVLTNAVPVAAHIGSGIIGGRFLGRMVGKGLDDVIESFRPQSAHPDVKPMLAAAPA